MLNILTDTDPDAPAPGPGPSWQPEPLPGNIDLLRRTVGNLASHPLRAVRVQARIVRQLADAAGIHSLSSAATQAGAGIKAIARLGKGDGPTIPLPTTPAPPTPWNKTITGHRRFAMRTTSLENIKRLKAATGATVNDVVMAICAGGLREYLLAHDALPDRPLRAMVPVSIRTGEEADPWTNRVSAIVADLPTDCDDPVERVARCRQAMLDAKRLLDLVPANELVDLTQFSAPVLATAAVRLVSRLRLADRVAQPFNLVISNVPGPRQPLYLPGRSCVTSSRCRSSPTGRVSTSPSPVIWTGSTSVSSSIATSCQTCGSWPTCTSPRSVDCSTPPAPNGPNHRSRPLRDAAQLSLPRRPPSQRPTSRPRRPILVPNCRNQLSRDCSLNRRPQALLAR